MDLFLKKFYSNTKLRMNKEEQLRFLQRLLRLLKNGYPILQALDKIKWDRHLSASASIVINALKNGDTIDQAFEKAHFHHTITSFLYFIRANNDLEGSLEKCINMFQQRMTNARKFKQILRYPLILFVIFSLLLYIIKQSVLPSFAETFQSESSTSINYSIMFIDFLSSFLILSIIIFITLSLIWLLFKSYIPIEKSIQLYKKIPGYRDYLRMQSSYFFASHFSSLLKTGMSFKEILQHMSNQQKLPIISYCSKFITTQLNEGIHLSYALSRLSFLDRQLISIFQKDTDVQALEMDLSVYVEVLMEEMEMRTIKIFTLLQPIFFIIIGSFIIFIYVSLMWPMFQLIKTI
ncbi:competence type IV pilus assembly protein ComGB [Oceanobacillus salinisoli]|uniref:competence type IV pilus assembly protein ComGB n=1 Tax=Oceanobacillus salinisoli TaxID=2678611 RepID=UPI0012E2F694|nr:competence type IV pilus assembly protein ComGB [Oceanobacillus salinisoli]